LVSLSRNFSEAVVGINYGVAGYGFRRVLYYIVSRLHYHSQGQLKGGACNGCGGGGLLNRLFSALQKWKGASAPEWFARQKGFVGMRAGEAVDEQLVPDIEGHLAR